MACKLRKYSCIVSDKCIKTKWNISSLVQSFNIAWLLKSRFLIEKKQQTKPMKHLLTLVRCIIQIIRVCNLNIQQVILWINQTFKLKSYLIPKWNFWECKLLSPKGCMSICSKFALWKKKMLRYTCYNEKRKWKINNNISVSSISHLTQQMIHQALRSMSHHFNIGKPHTTVFILSSLHLLRALL